MIKAAKPNGRSGTECESCTSASVAAPFFRDLFIVSGTPLLGSNACGSNSSCISLLPLQPISGEASCRSVDIHQPPLQPSTLDTVLAAVQANSKLLNGKIDGLLTLPAKIYALSSKIDELARSITELVDELSGKVDALTAQNHQLFAKTDALEAVRADHAAEIAQLMDRIKMLERNALRRNLFLAGIPQLEAEDLLAIFRFAMALLSVAVPDSEIVEITRIKSTTVTDKPTSTLVRFHSMDARNRVLAAKRARSHMYADELSLVGEHPHTPVFIHEHLSPS